MYTELYTKIYFNNKNFLFYLVFSFSWTKVKIIVDHFEFKLNSD